MENKSGIISILCFANYCRSPVAEKILSEKFKNITFFSYGINPKIGAEMDPRSRNYLEEIKIKDCNHIPRKVGMKEVRSSELILCMDHQVLMYMNMNYPKQKSRFKLFNFKNPSTIIEDPYRLEHTRYFEVMKKIYTVCSDLESNDLIG